MRNELKKLAEERLQLWEGTMKPLVLLDERDAEQQAEYKAAEEDLERLDGRIDELASAIEREAAQEAAAERRAELLQDTNPGIAPEDVQEDEERYADAFWTYIREGEDRITGEQRELLEARAQSTGVGSEGGFTVPEDFWTDIISARDRFGGLRQAPVTVIQTDNGRDLPVPTDNEAGVKGELVAENAAATEQEVVFGQTVLKAFLWSSKLIRAPRSLLQDSAFNLEAFLSGKFGERIGRIQADYFHDGTGSSEPQGIMTGTTVGRTAETAGGLLLTYDDFVELEHSVDPAYREVGHYAISDGALKAARLIKDQDDRPLWAPGMATDIPATINGYPYTVVQEFPTPAIDAKVAVFGDLSYYWIRDVIDFEAIRLDELFAQNRQVGFIAWARADGRNLSPGNDPYKVLQMAAA